MKQWYQLPFVKSQDNGIYKGYILNSGCWDRPQLMCADKSLDKVIK